MAQCDASVSRNSTLLQLQRILQSRTFRKAQRSRRLLRYLTEAALCDPPLLVKEYTLALEVFDRDPAYDPAVDATVRVEASRLRSRLREYYDEEGQADALCIEVAKGSYRASFREHQPLQRLQLTGQQWERLCADARFRRLVRGILQEETVP